MKVAVHFGVDALSPSSAHARSDTPRGGRPTVSPPPRRETWGMLCQRFVESCLHHPSRLLRLLNSLQPGGRSYKFRYGSGRATIIHPTWSDNGLNAGAVLEKEEGAMVEANVTLRPRKRSLGKVKNLTQVQVSASLEDSTQLHVDFHIEKIGMEAIDADYDDKVVPFLSQDPPRGGSFPMTQTPFPTDDSKTHVLRLKEHDQFEGVVDNFSIKKLNGEDIERADVDYYHNRKTSHGETGATPAIGPAASPPPLGTPPVVTGDASKPPKKRILSPTAAAAAGDVCNADSMYKNEKEDGGEEEATVEKPATKPAEDAAAITKRNLPRRKTRAAVLGSSMEKVKAAPLSILSSKKFDQGASVTDPTKRSSKRKSKDGAAAAAAAAEPAKKLFKNKIKYGEGNWSKGKKKGKEEGKESKGSSRKKKKEASGGGLKKGEEDGKEKRRSSRKKTRWNDDDEGVNNNVKEKKGSGRKNVGAGDGPKEKKGGMEELPKRPPNAFLMFAREARPRIKDENPGMRPTEMPTKLGEAFKALSEEERKRYIDAAREAFDRFKEDHPGLPRNFKRKRDFSAAGKDDSHDGDNEGGEDEDRNDGGCKDKRPKRAMNSYTMFVKDMRPKIKEENPGASTAEIMAKVGKAYRDLDSTAKKRYMEAADVARAKFKEEDGDEAFQNRTKKAKGKKHQHNRYGAGTVKRHRFDGIPAEPAKGLPVGWTTRSIPRKIGDRSDMFWFSPIESYTLRSVTAVRRFQESLVEVGGEDEVAAMKLYVEREKERRNDSSSGRDGGTKNRKRKRVSAI